MVSRPPDEYLTFLVAVLQATAQSRGDRQVVYPLLEANLDKLNDNFVQLFRRWAIAQFTNAPSTRATKIATTIVNFSNLVQEFSLGKNSIKLEIAIAGYEAALQVFNQQAFPQDWASTQQALASAYRQRQHILERTIAELKQKTAETQIKLETLTEPLQQELLQTRQQVEELRTAIARLEELTSNPVPATDITPLASVLQDLHSANQPFNTAIFYDIENLVMGNRQPIFNFSLRAIIQKVKEIPGVKQLAIQCAYANWSDPRLGRMRNDILELGIEPIQIFGFNSQKNAADIQLVIDVIELYYHRFSIENFVIVSGDGAFASLAKKLHEYGKIVIGCAYERQVNRVLKSVCDAFIPLPDPREEIKITFSETSTIKTIAQSDTQLSHNNFVVIIREKLELLKHENETRSYLEKSGIAISQVHHFLKRHISNFEERRKLWGYNKLLSLLKIAAEETNLCISKDNINLILKKDVNIESNIFYRHTFSAKSQSSTKYREILKTGYPLFNLPLLEHLRMVIRYAINNRPKGETWQEFEEQLRKTIGQEVSRRAIQRSLTALRSAGCFQEQPSPESWQLQPCILNSNLESEEAILDALRNSMRKKLLEELLEIDESILQEILP